MVPTTAATPSTPASASVREPFAPRTLLRDGVAAGAVIAGLYGLLYAVPLPPFAIPGYLTIVAFDALEAVLPPFTSSAAYDAAFATFLGVLALLSALAASWTRAHGAPDGWRPGVAGAFATLGALALALAAGVFLRYAAGDFVPLLLVTGTGVALLVGGAAVAFGSATFARDSA
ncbi:hypothetical protein [Halorarum salinum]|uniref:Uncharacterized protein n=1 Tax=Halorarum salinum TaxID=2743089 RepID=A0A7D5QFV5_9EURY|nr:hypothetical protein [Halobaculum salinum]QLG63721.1 hypothetical protein HUG12_19115 [Halobaculum salinum]